MTDNTLTIIEQPTPTLVISEQPPPTLVVQQQPSAIITIYDTAMPGAAGTKWFVGDGSNINDVGQPVNQGDQYLDTTTGDIYVYAAGSPQN